MKFAIIGAGGYIAPRHLKAIKDTGNYLAAACDINDSVGVLDGFFPHTPFFTEIERFDRHLEKLRRSGNGIDFLSVCSPNYLHDAHCRLGMRVGANVICEKPMVIKPWNLDQLQELEHEFSRTVYTVLQLRLHSSIRQLAASLASDTKKKAVVDLTYVTPRGPWYDVSWKGDDKKSGGILMNIGIHFFDLLLWLFGPVEYAHADTLTASSSRGVLTLEKANVTWFLSTNWGDVPPGYKGSYRTLTVNGTRIDMSSRFTDLHTKVYQQILHGGGYRIDDVRPAIKLVDSLKLG